MSDAIAKAIKALIELSKIKTSVAISIDERGRRTSGKIDIFTPKSRALRAINKTHQILEKYPNLIDQEDIELIIEAISDFLKCKHLKRQGKIYMKSFL